MQPQSQTQSLVLRLLHDPTVEGPLAFQRQEIEGGHDSAGASLSPITGGATSLAK
jgi:hypothetical protein